MEETVYYSLLYDYYGELLTEKQREYFEDYYFNNLSLSEMALNYNVSRNAIHRQIHLVIDKLNNYETKLMLVKKYKKLEEIINNLDDDKLKKQLEDLL